MNSKSCFFGALFVVAIVVIGMILVAHNGNDPFTSFWGYFGKLISISESMK